MPIIQCLFLFFAAVMLGGCSTSPDANSAGADAVESMDGEFAQLRADLLDLAKRDREARTVLVEAMQDAEPLPDGGMQFGPEGWEAMQRVGEIDAESTAFLKRTVDRVGWPTVSMVGAAGAHAAWLLAQHADADPDFQAEVLALMEPLVDRGEAKPRHFALLTDRVLLARGEMQVYGTQFQDDADGVMRPMPTRDWATVDERRASVGLAPLAEYAADLAESYGKPAEPEPSPAR